jgi:twitching motility protein PilT
MNGLDGLVELFRLMVGKGASDLHLRVPSPPVLRIDGALTTLEDLPPITPQDVETLLAQITPRELNKAFRKKHELDFAYSVPGLARFRVSVLRQRGTLSFAFRLVPFKVLSADDLGLPQIFKEFILKPRGLILITGSTGSGKTTTAAAMIDHVNENEARNIITIEDPIEYLHSNKKCLIAQRDLGDDTESFDIALRHTLRHDPDIIVVGEMRDLATISTAITAAETGHLVLGTLHTTDASQTVDRIIDVFPPVQQQQIRLQLSQVLEAVISQSLLPCIAGGRIAAFEIMTVTPAVRNVIREGKTFELPNIMRLGARDNMQTLDQALAGLVNSGSITKEEAMMKSSNPEQLDKLLKHQYVAMSVQTSM